MSTFATFIASRLTEKGKQLGFKLNSVLTPVDNGEDNTNMIPRAIADKALAEINFYYNTLTPMFRQLADFVLVKVEQFNTKTPVEDYKIVEFTPSEFLKESVSKDQISEPREIQAFKSDAVIIGELESDEEYVKYFTHPNALLDDFIAPLRSQYDLRDVWGKYLSTICITQPLTDLDLFKYKNSDLLSLIYTASINLKKEKPVVCNVDDDKYDAATTAFNNEVMNLVSRSVSYTRHTYSTNRLILDYDANKKIILVSKDKYAKFLEDESNTPDILLGMFSNGLVKAEETEKFDMDKIIANKEIYRDNWKKTLNDAAIINNLNKADSTKGLYLMGFQELFNNNIPDSIKEQYELNYNDIEARLNIYLNGLDSSQLLEVDKTALDILGGIIFKDTNYSHIARTMMNYSKLLEDSGVPADPKSIALYTLIDYTTDYLLEQVVIV